MRGVTGNVLILGAGADWEPALLSGLEEAGVIVVRRCVDLADLVAAASTGTAGFAVVEAGLSGLDAEVVRRLADHGVGLVPVTADPATLRAGPELERIGAGPVRPARADVVVEALRTAVRAAPEPGGGSGGGERADRGPEHGPEESGRVVAVWGPTGAPGRTTVAITLAAVVAGRPRRTTLLDLDPYGGTVAQQLGVLDQVSGLLAAARLSNAGALDADSFDRCCRAVDGSLAVLTGLPRADRWPEVRPGAVADLVRAAGERGDVVLDCGLGLATDEERVRDRLTVEALGCADEVVIVGSADPVGLARLARAQIEFAEVIGPVPTRVVVNRMRTSLGWQNEAVVGMVQGYGRPLSVHLLPDDRELCDRAAAGGRPLTELGPSGILSSLTDLAQVCFPGAALGSKAQAGRRRSERVRLSFRRAGTGR